eukprot:1151031-Pelagomonas_calceolata.AAC.10
MQAAPAIHCFLTLLKQSAADHTPETPSPTHQGLGLLLIASANFLAFISQLMERIISPRISIFFALRGDCMHGII